MFYPVTANKGYISLLFNKKKQKEKKGERKMLQFLLYFTFTYFWFVCSSILIKIFLVLSCSFVWIAATFCLPNLYLLPITFTSTPYFHDVAVVYVLYRDWYNIHRTWLKKTLLFYVRTICCTLCTTYFCTRVILPIPAST